MKIRIDFVTNSSSSNYLVYRGAVHMGMYNLTEIKKILKEIYLNVFENEINEWFLDDDGEVWDHLFSIEPLRTPTTGPRGSTIITFDMATWVPYSRSIQEMEGVLRRRIIEAGLVFNKDVIAEVEAIWE